MGIKQLYNDNLRKLPNEYGDVSVMQYSLNFDLILILTKILNVIFIPQTNINKHTLPAYGPAD